MTCRPGLARRVDQPRRARRARPLVRRGLADRRANLADVTLRPLNAHRASFALRADDDADDLAGAVGVAKNESAFVIDLAGDDRTAGETVTAIAPGVTALALSAARTFRPHLPFRASIALAAFYALRTGIALKAGFPTIANWADLAPFTHGTGLSHLHPQHPADRLRHDHRPDLRTSLADKTRSPIKTSGALQAGRPDFTARTFRANFALRTVGAGKALRTGRTHITLRPDRTDCPLRPDIAALALNTAVTLRTNGAGNARQAITAIARQALLERDEARGQALHAVPDVREICCCMTWMSPSGPIVFSSSSSRMSFGE
jgi:hypothetical protein